MTPQTIEEWAVYIATLSGEALRSKAMAANSLDFMRGLEAEGTSPRETMKILRLFAQQFQLTGQEPPSRYPGALVDFGALLEPPGLPSSS